MLPETLHMTAEAAVDEVNGFFIIEEALQNCTVDQYPVSQLSLSLSLIYITRILVITDFYG